MAKKMLIDATHAEETRVVVVDGNKVEEFDFESENKRQIAGNIYLAKVTRVEPSLQAAFVDYGGNRHGFLAFAEIHPDYYQIPVADREALLAEEMADAAAEDDDAPAETASQAPEADTDAEGSGPRRSRSGRSRRRGGRGRRDDSNAEAASKPASDGIAGMDVVEPDGGSDASTGPDTAEVAPAAEEGVPETSEAADAALTAAEPVDTAPVAVEAPAPDETDGVRAASDAATPAGSGIAGTGEADTSSGDASTDEADEGSDDASNGSPRTIAADTVRDAVIREGDPTPTEPETDAGVPVVEGAASEAPAESADSEDASDEAPAEAPARDDISAPASDDAIEAVADDDSPDDIRPARRARPRRYKIQEVVKVRQIMLVQVVKEERGNKGAALTTYLSLAGRYCVLMPNTARGGGISRKITNVADRKKLKEIATELDVPKGAGLIVRTAGAKRTRAEIKRDYEYLQRLWEQIRELTLKSVAPAKIYEEGDLIKRSIRDLYNREIDEVLVEGEAGYRIAKDFMRMIMPSHAKNVQPYAEAMPLFARYQVETTLAEMFNPTVKLKSGGYIVIGVTEALVAVDVNSGKSTKEGSIEETALKTNLEAAEEVARQCRLRDLAGLIVIDFIDMDERKNNAAVEKRLKEKLKTDRARIQMGRISGFGLLEMSRQRLRPGMIEATTQPCAHCHGTGLVRSSDNVALSILRELEEEGVRNRTGEVLVKAPVVIANYLINEKREHIARIEARYGMAVRVEADVALVSPNFTVEKFKTASRKVEAAPPVVSVDISDLPDIDSDEGDAADAADAAETVGAADAAPEAVPAATGADDGKPKKRRRKRRRRKGGNGDGAANGNGNGDGSATDQGEAGEAPAPAPGQAPVTEVKADAPKSQPAPEAEAAPAPEAAPAETAGSQTPVAAEKESSPAPETSAEATPEPAEGPEPAEPAPAESPAAETAAASTEAAVEEPAGDTAADTGTDETGADETGANNTAAAREEPAKPKKRGWWSVGF